MPPRKKPSKSAEATESTPRRSNRSRLARVKNKNTSPEGATSSPDEVRAGAPANESMHMRCLRSRSRTASTSQSEGTAIHGISSRGSTPIRKHELQVAASDDGDEEDELAAGEPTTKKVKMSPTKPIRLATFRRGRSKWDDADEMLTNSNSPLVKTNLRDILCSSRAWDVLTLEEKQQVLAKFPDQTEILDAGTPDARPSIAALRNNDDFRHDVAQYQENLGQGYHDPEWIRQAQAAHRARHAGLYDGLLATEFEQKWDAPMPALSQNSNGNGRESNERSTPPSPVASPDSETAEAHSSADSSAQCLPAQNVGTGNIDNAVPTNPTSIGDAANQGSLVEQGNLKHHEISPEVKEEMLPTAQITTERDENCEAEPTNISDTNESPLPPHTRGAVEQGKEEQGKEGHRSIPPAEINQEETRSERERENGDHVTKEEQKDDATGTGFEIKSNGAVVQGERTTVSAAHTAKERR